MQDGVKTTDYEKRENLIRRTIALENTGETPFMTLYGYYPAKVHGYTCRDIMVDYDKTMDAYVKTTETLKPAAHDNPFPTRFYARLLEATDFQTMKWPGHGVGEMSGIQFVEAENMKADEYQELLADPGSFMLRRFWPRIFGACEGLTKLPDPIALYGHQAFGEMAAFADEDVIKSFEALVEAGRHAQRMIKGAVEFNHRMKDMGFPPQFGGVAQAPFDALSDYFRGAKGAMLDMYRHPDEVLEAVDLLLPLMIKRGLSAKKRGVPRVFMPLHKGLDGFMSPPQFERFYWPSLRKVIMALVEEGITPFCFWEGDCTTRLETMADVPPGKVVHWFERTDIKRAKEVLSGIACVRGGVPISLLISAKPEAVTEYCRNLIKTVGKDGGFILDASTVLDDAKPENVMAMAESVRLA